ncbi:hydrogenase-1 operon protein HyaF [Rhodovulum imhoffii]|uniref:Hydrogenase-1 operon protein HyaF n=1 Tax=Rhodovulum imhoffii TaxID=365340 RepID=A0A2T5BS91_9RHOB|nr:hydrogenase expression/formation protein [Rhodovulum imhoffii]MBK5934745.1 hydrogenase expression/formation protein [Rhodovulum imhoffii]PTN02169.1 hydrogenase-1 operon protein HyaF [Rhodovulum imhoffii]
MTSDFRNPPRGFGPGSQPVPEGEGLEYMPLPSDMWTYSPHLPEVENPEAVVPALDVLRHIAQACTACARDGTGARFDLSGLPPAARRLIADTLGQGEVAMKIRSVPALAVQESVFAGVWQLLGEGVDAVEIGAVPETARSGAFRPIRAAQGASTPPGEGVINAPSLLAELHDKALNYRPGSQTYVVNLSLLPHTEADLAWLDAALGEGGVTILSRGYGNCRITATATAPVWRVQFFNSMDTLILDTFEVADIPEVALAAAEDLSDSAARIHEVLEAIR